MKTFEEKWTAWLDGELSGSELAAFEASLPDRVAAEAEKQAAQKLRLLLKRELSISKLANEEFFSHQLRERIGHEGNSNTGRERRSSGWWTVPRLLWSGTFAMAVFLVCTVWVMQDNDFADQSPLTTKVLNAK